MEQLSPDVANGEVPGSYAIMLKRPDYTIEDTLAMGSYELGPDYMQIHDTVWGDEHIGDEPYDQLLVELAHTPLFQRLQHIEQLTLDPQHATMPNSMYFSRWQHIWGSVVFVRKMLEGRDDIDDRQKMVLQLRTLLSDVGHTAFSHLGDWMFQGVDGGEDMHDEELKAILRSTGIAEIIERYGFSLDEVVFPDIHDWVETSSPDLCVDRVDYGFREIMRWVVPTIPLNLEMQALHNPQQIFEINSEGRLLMKNAQMARYFAAGFSLLAGEHWSHPVHRLQLQLFQSAIRSSVIDKVEQSSAHPRDAFYGVDDDFQAHLKTWPMQHLEKAMQDIGLSQREIFTKVRRHDLNSLFMGIQNPAWEFPAFPDPLESYSEQGEKYGKPYPPNVSLEEVKADSGPPLDWSEQGLVVNLPPLKQRSIDPPVKTETGVLRLSEIEPSYKTYRAQQQTTTGRAYKVTVHMRPDVAQKIVAEHRKAEDVWGEVLARARSNRHMADAMFAPRLGRPIDEIHHHLGRDALDSAS